MASMLCRWLYPFLLQQHTVSTQMDLEPLSVLACCFRVSCRWLHDWRSLPGAADKRRRGEAPALYTHKECHMLLQQKLNIPVLHSNIWPIVEDRTVAADGIPDGLPPSSYGGIADVLDTAASRSSATTLSPSFKIDKSWMLYSPLVCTKQASRILAIWTTKLGAGPQPRSIVQHLNSLLLNSICKVGVLEFALLGCVLQAQLYSIAVSTLRWHVWMSIPSPLRPVCWTLIQAIRYCRASSSCACLHDVLVY